MNDDEMAGIVMPGADEDQVVGGIVHDATGDEEEGQPVKDWIES